jgi:DNA-binding FadR family transcriptional regulator
MDDKLTDRSVLPPARSRTAKVSRSIGLAIVSGRYPQNAVLPGVPELMQRHGVSRTVLREAMKTLAGKGLIEAKARIGTRVRDRQHWNLFDPDVLLWHAASGFDPPFLVQLSEMRMALEPEAAAVAAERRTDEELREMYASVDRMGAPGVTAEGFVEADLDFHLAVAKATGNPFMRSISTLIEVALVAVLTVSQPVRYPVRHDKSIADHRAIADAISRGDTEGARAAMRLVIQDGVNALTGKAT